jgi:hypothetical protein
MVKKSNYFRFRCYAYPKKNNGINGYSAVCIDLSLTTWRPTLEETKISLHQAINGYLETMRELLAEEKIDSFDQLKSRIYRPAPFFPYRLSFDLLRVQSLLAPILTIKVKRDWYCEQQLKNLITA